MRHIRFFFLLSVIAFFTACDRKDADQDGYVDDCSESEQFYGGVREGGRIVAHCGDCDDTNPDIKPNAMEICDGIDNNCNGKVDEWQLSVTNDNKKLPGVMLYGEDHDGDGFGASHYSVQVLACSQPDGYVVDTTDRNDEDPDSYPGASEICDDKDNDYDGEIDEALVDCDADGDGVAKPSDCDEADPDIYPGTKEICDGIDNNCNGRIDNPATVCTIVPAEGPTYFQAEKLGLEERLWRVESVGVCAAYKIGGEWRFPVGFDDWAKARCNGVPFAK